MSGGEILISHHETAATQSVEVLKLDGRAWCTLPDLPHTTYLHTQSGLISCGGWTSDFEPVDNCVKFSEGHWNKSHDDLDVSNDCAWSSSQHGTRIFGGYTVELLADNGETPEVDFGLEYYTS